MTRKIAYFFIITIVFSCKSQHNESTRRLGNFSNRPRGFFSVYMPGGQIALFIPNNLKEPSTITNVRFYIGNKGNYRKPFRLRLFCRDSISGKPGKELLKTPVIVNSVEKYGWHLVSLADYNNIDFPSGGIFVSMEWIPNDDFNELTQSECQFLAYSKMDKNNTWYCALGINWYQLPKANYNAMISADIKKRGLN